MNFLRYVVVRWLSSLFFTTLFLCLHAAADITGRVFHDFNANGSYDTTATLNNTGSGTINLAVDIGIVGVTVEAYDQNGALAATTTSSSSGLYTLSGLSADVDYRIEFTELPAGYHYGPRSTDSVGGGTATSSGSSVQFASDGDTGVSLSIQTPHEYCQNDPALVTATYVSGDQNSATPVLLSFPYSAGSTSDLLAPYELPLTHSVSVPASSVGTTLGTAYARTARIIYVASYMKKHTDFGPQLSAGLPSTGTIYQIPVAISGAATSASTYTDLNALFGVNTAGANPHDSSDYVTDGAATNSGLIGKVALGGLAIDDSEKNLFVMNLANRTLYKIPLDATPTSSNVTFQAAPTALPNCPAAGDARPFAVLHSIYNNVASLYVGLICSGESTGQTSDLWAYVYRVDPETLAFDSTPKLQFRLNYNRRFGHTGFPELGEWRAWFDAPAPDFSPTPGSFSIPQPILADLAIDSGDLILGFRDRYGDQGRSDGVVGVGDVLRACGDPDSGWTLESNGRCGGEGAGPQDTGEGPGATNVDAGSGEFYFRDGYGYSFADAYSNSNVYAGTFADGHDDTSFGGVTVIPGFPDVVMTGLDPFPIQDVVNGSIYNSGGMRWMSNSTGALMKAYQIYPGTFGFFSKANGLGIPRALCNAAPIQIGNRVWADSNRNGIQDAGESPIPGVSVELYKAGVRVGQAVTDANGEYYFIGSRASDVNVTDHLGLVAGGIDIATGTLGGDSDYEVRIPNVQGTSKQSVLASLYLTSTNAASGTANADLRDSDGAVSSNDAIYTVTYAELSSPGRNSHTFDFGFSTACPEEANFATQQLTLDGVGFQLFRLARKAASMRKARSQNFQCLQISQSRAESIRAYAQTLYLNIWNNIWTVIPGKSYSCETGSPPQCSTLNLTSVFSQNTEAVTSLKNLVLTYTLSCESKLAKKLTAEVKRIARRFSRRQADLPTSPLSCSY